MGTKTERKLKLYGYESKWYDYPAVIRLKGKWLKEFGFTANTPIKVECKKNQLIITRLELG